MKGPRDWRAALRAIPIALAVAAFALWITYLPVPHPWTAFTEGLASVMRTSRSPFDSYALGRWSRDGWWRYFPLAAALKTTLGSLPVGLALVGMHDYRLLGYPTNYPVYPKIPATGWVAVSDHLYRRHAWRWLRGRPYQRVGASIRLYYL